MKLKQLVTKSIAGRESRLANLYIIMTKHVINSLTKTGRSGSEPGGRNESLEMMNTNGKLFEAPKKLLPVTDDSPRLDPGWRLNALDGQPCNLMSDLVSKNPASLFTISCSSFSDPMVETFRRPFLKSDLIKSCGLIDLRPIPSRLKYAIWAPFVKRAARKEIVPELQGSYFVYRGGRELRAMLGVPNLYGGYVMLLDRQGVVRWRASGTATEEELSIMFTSIRQLTTN